MELAEEFSSLRMNSEYQTFKTTYDEVTKTWNGNKLAREYGTRVNIGQLAVDRLLQHPTGISEVTHPGEEFSSNILVAISARRCSIHFSELRAKQGDVVGICADDSLHLTPLILGAFIAELTISTLDPCVDKTIIKHVYDITRPTWMFCSGTNYQIVKEAFQEINLKARIYTMYNHIPNVANIYEFLQYHPGERMVNTLPLRYGPTQTAAIICTSGTTGLPKPVCISYECLVNKVIMSFLPGDKLLFYGKLQWLSCLGYILGNVCSTTTRIIPTCHLEHINFIYTISKYTISCLLMNPVQLATVVATTEQRRINLNTIKKCIIVSGFAPYKMIEQIRPYMPNSEFFTSYDMCEAGISITGGVFKPNRSCGQLKNNTEVKILDKLGNKLGIHKIGEICLRSLYRWEGYYRNYRTSDAVRDVEGWLHTGDIGYFDEDGDLFIINRKEDFIQYGNTNIAPVHIEKFIHLLNGVAEVQVFGIPIEGSVFLNAAAIVRSPDAEGRNLNIVDVFNHVACGMPHFLQLDGGIYFMKAFPKTSTGKNLRRKIAQICIKCVYDNLNINP